MRQPRDTGQPEEATQGLSLAGQLFIWSTRRWILAACRREPPHLALDLPYSKLGCSRAIPLLDESLTLLAATARRQVALRCVPHPALSTDERILLQAMRSLQRGAERDARAIMTALVPQHLTHTFCRPAAAYARVLRGSGLALDPEPALRLIKS